MPAKTTKIKTTENISFRITQDLHRDLEKYARTQRDELGQQLSPPLAARRLFHLALKNVLSHTNEPTSDEKG